jgi:hypothetical protein
VSPATAALTVGEVQLAYWLAETRTKKARKAAARPAFGQDPAQTQSDDLTGTKGELGVAKLLGLYPNLISWEEEQATGGWDLAHRICVRASTTRRSLLIRPGDPMEGRHVHALVRGNLVTVTGWLKGHEACQERWLDDPQDRGHPCYLIPERWLDPLADLLALVAVERMGAAAAHKEQVGEPSPYEGRIKVRDNRSWFVHRADGTVSLVVCRKADGGAPNGHLLQFHGPSEEAALQEYLA